MRTSFKTYSILSTLPTFEERFKYLKLNGKVGEETFGYDRYMNQILYRNSKEWKDIRREVILRDNGCDLGVLDRPIYGPIYIHHLNPLTREELMERNPMVLDPENLIACSFRTHQAIHYSDEYILFTEVVERKRGDTTPWKVY